MIRLFSPFFLLVALLLGGCLRYDIRLRVINKTSAPIALQIFHDSLPTYPSLNKREYYLRAALSPGDSTGVQQMGDWVGYINTTPNKKLNLCVFYYRDVLNCPNIDSLIAHKRYAMKKVALPELQRKKWRVLIEE
jgi:hypothetical protein